MKLVILKILAVISMCVLIYVLWDELTSLPTYKYRVISENQGYRTNKYETVGTNCIKFIDGHNQTVTICGEYEIIENK